MSVEITTPQASACPLEKVNSAKIAAGTMSPATAAVMGTTARARSVSSPIVSSRLTSSPTRKKKKVMRPSLTTSCRVKAASIPPAEIDSGRFQNSS